MLNVRTTRGRDEALAKFRALRSLLPRVAGLAVLCGAVFCYSAVAEAFDEYDAARLNHPDLFQTYYDEGLLEYCGLLTQEAVRGFLLRRDELLAREPLTAEQHRQVRVAAGIAIDYQYDNHGLGGQRLWCSTDGRAAYERFVARYRAQDNNGNNSQTP